MDTRNILVGTSSHELLAYGLTFAGGAVLAYSLGGFGPGLVGALGCLGVLVVILVEGVRGHVWICHDDELAQLNLKPDRGEPEFRLRADIKAVTVEWYLAPVLMRIALIFDCGGAWVMPWRFGLTAKCVICDARMFAEALGVPFQNRL